MRLIVLLSITAAVVCWTFSSSAIGGVMPVPRSPDHFVGFEEEYASIPETCPVQCVYVKECGEVLEFLLPEDRQKHKNDTDPNSLKLYYYANGRGACDSSFLLDKKYCPIRDEIECLSKCGGPICSAKKHYASKSFFEDSYIQSRIRKYRNESGTG